MNKCSKSLSLILMSSLTVGIAGCASDDPGEEFKAYASIGECVKEQVYSPEECRGMAIAAEKQNPQFANQSECEKEFGEGNCKNNEAASQTEERRSSWMPLMAGYMVGRFIGGSGYMQGTQPLYNQPQQQGSAARTGGSAGSFRTLGGGAVQTDATGKVTNPSETVRKGFARTAKPHVARAATNSGGKSGGFSGGRSSS